MIPLIFLALMLAIWLVPRIWKGSFDAQTVSFIAAIALPGVLVFFWWGQLTATAFSGYVMYVDKVLANLGNLFVAEFRSHEILRLFTQSPDWPLASQITAYIQRVTFVIVGIGVASILISKQQRQKFSTYAVLMVVCIAILAAEIVLPWLSRGYSAERLYLQLLIVVAPAFVIGCQVIFMYPVD